MMSRSTRKSFRTVKNKRIGKVVIFVEGNVSEVDCFSNIFDRLLGYRVIRKTRSDKSISSIEELKSDKSSSVVTIANTKSSSPKSIYDCAFRDELFRELHERYKIDSKNCRVYYVWDRDRRSNKDSLMRRLLADLCNPFENLNFENGMIVLSFPCYESYLLSNFEDREYIDKCPKKYISGLKKKIYKPKNFSNRTLRRAASIMEKRLEKLGIDSVNYGDYYAVNRLAYDAEEQIYDNNMHNGIRQYMLLSMVSIILLDLGILVYGSKDDDN